MCAKCSARAAGCGRNRLGRGSAGRHGAPVRSADVTSVTGPIAIDGSLNEAAWHAAARKSATSCSGSRTRAAHRANAPRSRCSATRIISISGVVRLRLPEPNRIVGTQMVRDGFAGMPTMSASRLCSTRFAINEARTTLRRTPRAPWWTDWRLPTGSSIPSGTRSGKSARHAPSSGWTAEFAIPFKSLSFPAEQGVWGFNIARTISRNLEDDRWSGARLDTQFLQVSEAGEITNLGELTQGIGLDLRPFFAGSWLHLAGDERRQASPTSPGSICSTASRRA